MGNQHNFAGIAKNLDSTMLSPENPDKNSLMASLNAKQQTCLQPCHKAHQLLFVLCKMIPNGRTFACQALKLPDLH